MNSRLIRLALGILAASLQTYSPSPRHSNLLEHIVGPAVSELLLHMLQLRAQSDAVPGHFTTTSYPSSGKADDVNFVSVHDKAFLFVEPVMTDPEFM